jgi:hypothetical protein
MRHCRRDPRNAYPPTLSRLTTTRARSCCEQSSRRLPILFGGLALANRCRAFTRSSRPVVANIACRRRDLEPARRSIVGASCALVTAPASITRQLQTRLRLAGMPLALAIGPGITWSATAQLGQAHRDLLEPALGSQQARLGVGTRTLGTEPYLLVAIPRHPPTLSHARPYRQAKARQRPPSRPRKPCPRPSLARSASSKTVSSPPVATTPKRSRPQPSDVGQSSSAADTRSGRGSARRCGRAPRPPSTVPRWRSENDARRVQPYPRGPS